MRQRGFQDGTVVQCVGHALAALDFREPLRNGNALALGEGFDGGLLCFESKAGASLLGRGHTHVGYCVGHINNASASKGPANRCACLRALRRVRCNASTDANRPRYLPAQSCPIGLKRSRSRFDGCLGCALLAVDPSPFGVRVGTSIPVSASLFTATLTLTCAYLTWRALRRSAVVVRFQVPLLIAVSPSVLRISPIPRPTIFDGRTRLRTGMRTGMRAGMRPRLR